MNTIRKSDNTKPNRFNPLRYYNNMADPKVRDMWYPNRVDGVSNPFGKNSCCMGSTAIILSTYLGYDVTPVDLAMQQYSIYKPKTKYAEKKVNWNNSKKYNLRENIPNTISYFCWKYGFCLYQTTDIYLVKKALMEKYYVIDWVNRGKKDVNDIDEDGDRKEIKWNGHYFVLQPVGDTIYRRDVNVSGFTDKKTSRSFKITSDKWMAGLTNIMGDKSLVAWKNKGYIIVFDSSDKPTWVPERKVIL